MRISDWSSDVCSSDLVILGRSAAETRGPRRRAREAGRAASGGVRTQARFAEQVALAEFDVELQEFDQLPFRLDLLEHAHDAVVGRSEERRVGKAWVSTCRSRW